MVLVESLLCDCVSIFIGHLFVFLRFVNLVIFLIVFIFAANSSLVCFDISDNIDVGSINVFQRSALGIYSDTHRFVDTCNLNTISRPYLVDHIFIGTKMDSLGCFTLRNALGRLLDFNMLLV